MESNNAQTMNNLQDLIKEVVSKYNIETSPELRYIDLTSEIGEVGKEILKGNNYGKSDFTKTDNIEYELGDSLFSLICIANSLDINLNEALIKTVDKYENRFKKAGDIGSDSEK